MLSRSVWPRSGSCFLGLVNGGGNGLGWVGYVFRGVLLIVWRTYWPAVGVMQMWAAPVGSGADVGGLLELESEDGLSTRRC